MLELKVESIHFINVDQPDQSYTVYCLNADIGGPIITSALSFLLFHARNIKISASDESMALARQTLQRCNEFSTDEQGRLKLNLLEKELSTVIYDFVIHLGARLDYESQVQDFAAQQMQFIATNLGNFLSINANEILSIDEKFISFLNHLGRHAKKHAHLCREKSIERTKNKATLWHLWEHATEEEDQAGFQHEKSNSHWINIKFPRFFHLLAYIVWSHIVKPKWEIEKRKKINPPAVPETIARTISDGYGWNQSTILHHDEPSGDLLIVNRNGLPPNIIGRAPAIEVERGRSMFGIDLAAAYPSLATRAGQELIQWVIQKVWQRTFEQASSPLLLEYKGGLDALREEIGLASNKDTTTLLEALSAGKSFAINIPGEVQVFGLWTATLEPARRGKPARLLINASPFLAPHFRRNERLVPIVPTPQLVGKRNDYSAQMAFKFELILSMAKADDDLLNGGVLLPPTELERLAESTRLPILTMNKALDCWTKDGDSPRMLDRDGDRFLLADTNPYLAARNFLLEGATRIKEGRERGQQSVISREKARKGRKFRSKNDI